MWLSIDYVYAVKLRTTYYPRFGFIPKTGMAFPETGVLFFLCSSSEGRGVRFGKDRQGEV